MSVIGSNVLAGASGQAAGYEIERSLRFNDSDSAYLGKNFSSAGNRRTWSFACWVKRSELGTTDDLFNAGGNSTQPRTEMRFKADDTFTIGFSPTGSSWYSATTSAVFRDPSAWYHIVVACDTTQSTSSDRLKLYVNGALQTFASASYVPQNTETPISDSTYPHSIGRYQSGGSAYLDGYLADVHFIDGQALAPTDFGEYDDNGVWQPKAYSGTYGTNGFHLDFSDNSSNAALGDDSSGNNNDWTVNNITAEGVDYSHALIASTGFTSSNPKTNAFNASVTDYAETNAGTNNQGSPGAYIELQETFTNVTSLKVQYRPSGSGGVWAFRVTGTGITQTDVSGASVFALAPINLSSTTISDIRVSTLDNNNPSFLTAIEINGTRLIDEGSDVDSLVDSPTNGTQTDTGAGGEVVGNYATLNPLVKEPTTTLSNGNLDASFSGWQSTFATIAYPKTGKWYYEFATLTASGAASDGLPGIAEVTDNLMSATGTYFTGAIVSYGYYGLSGNTSLGPSAAASSYGDTFGPGDIIGVAFDADAGTLTFYKNGVSQGTAFTGLTGTYVPAVAQAGGSIITNFGQRAFAYTAPSGFKALCTTNLTDPTIADGSTAMDVALYTGNGSTQTISGLGFSPDLVWIKERNGDVSHQLYDGVRGATKKLSSNTADAEATTSTGLTSFDSTGFSLGSYSSVNNSSDTYVAWAWDGGTSTVSNTDGSITSSVRANASAGFSIVSYTGTGANATIGHGGLTNLSNGMIIIKNRDKDPTNWRVYHSALGNTKMIYLSYNGTPDTSSVYWNNTSPTSTVFSVGSDDGVNENGDAIIAYCFAPVAGYSAFGSYTGNGSSQFIYLGFRPKFWIHKRTDSSGSWMMVDSVRSSYNVAQDQLYANLSNAESQYGGSGILDFVSNGVVLRSTGADVNGSSVPYVYMAFGENPFSIARAR